MKTHENESGTFEIGGDLTVNRLGFGAMRLCGDQIIGSPDDEEEARDVLRRADDIGVDFIDTADSYGPGTSERLIGETLDVDRDDLVVATKAGLLRNNSGDWKPHGDPDYIRNQVLASLDRLRTDQIDLYQYHRPDPDGDFEETVTTFGELQDEGFVAHVGLSNVSVEQLETARDHVDVATVQNNYNLENRDHEDVLQACEDAGIGFIPYFPVGAGGFDERESVVEEVAEARDATQYQVALAWLLQHSDVTLPIPGTSRIDHLEENVAASQLELSEDELSKLSD